MGYPNTAIAVAGLLIQTMTTAIPGVQPHAQPAKAATTLIAAIGSGISRLSITVLAARGAALAEQASIDRMISDLRLDPAADVLDVHPGAHLSPEGYLPFADQSFDAVVSRLSLRRLSNRAARGRLLCEAVRVLKPGGELLVVNCGDAGEYVNMLVAEGLHLVRRRPASVLAVPRLEVLLARKPYARKADPRSYAGSSGGVMEKALP